MKKIGKNILPKAMILVASVVAACDLESEADFVENSAEIADDLTNDLTNELTYEISDLVLLDELADLKEAEPPEETEQSVDVASDFKIENSIESGLRCGFGCPAGEAILYTTCSWGCGSCDWPAFDNASYCSPAPPVPIVASISASPNPVPVQAGSLGGTSVCWNLSGLAGRKVWVKVSANGNPQQIFNGERDNGLTCITAPWIQENGHYVFTVETLENSNSVIATTTVTGVTAAPTPDPGGDPWEDCHLPGSQYMCP